ncbi:MAG: hypothetical protein WC805_03825 [Patescibacteria group bacterium]|jgi:hypothetical protein
MYRGWIKLYRKSLDSDLWQHQNAFRVFTYLLLKTNAGDNGISVIFDGSQYYLKNGECVTGRKYLAKETGLTEQNIRTALNYLKSTNRITTKFDSKKSLVSICSWDKYQHHEEDKSTSKLTSNQPSVNQQLTTKQEYKNIRIKENRERQTVANAPTPLDVTTNFFSNQDTQTQLINELVAKGIPQPIASAEIAKFISYWTELSPSGNKQLWQTKPTFEIRKRLTAWFNKIESFNSYKSKKGIRI